MDAQSMPRDAFSFVMNRTIPVPESGCWIWTGSENGRGYGRFRFRGIQLYAHRVVFQFIKGEISLGMQLDHLCRVRCCVNPDHLEPVSNRTNSLRGIGPTAINARKVCCTNGHALTGDNLYVNPCNGSRNCRICRVNYRRRYYENVDGQYRARRTMKKVVFPQVEIEP